MKKMATQLALVACAILLAGSASAQTDTTGRPVPDTVSRPVPDDTTRMPRDKKRHKKDKKMPKDSLNRATPISNPTAVFDAQLDSSLSTTVVYTNRELINAKELYLKEEELTTAS